MKGLKKLTLASAIVAAPFASQAMEALDDATMGDVTGQAGVTIVTEADVTIGSITYTDGDGDGVLVMDTSGANPGDPGYVDTYAPGILNVRGISVGSANNGAVAITQTIDVTDAGLEIGISGITDLKATIDSIEIGGAGAASIGALRIDADISNQTQTIESGGAVGVGGTGGVTISQEVTISDVDVLYVDGEFTHDGTDGFVNGVDTSTPGHGAGVYIDSLSTTALTIEQSIDVFEYDTNGAAPGGTQGALAITSQGMSGTISIGGVRFLTGAESNAVAGSTTDALRTTAVENAPSIGSIAINGLSMEGSTTYIYAH